MKAGGNKVDYVGKGQRLFDGIVKNLKFLGADGQILTAGKSGKIPPGQIRGNGTGSTPEKFQYFYHPDHLGSTSYVTDASGEVYQHLEYFAFGETFVEEHSNTDRTPYLFNGKELDEETGLYYYGARYYDARTSVWQSVDPLADKYPGLSPFAYVANNPLTYVDPDGKEIVLPKTLTVAQRPQIVSTLQKLTDDKLYFDPKTNRVKIAGLAKSGTETNVNGTRLLRRLNSSDKTITIDIGTAGSGNSARPDSRTATGKTDWTKSKNGTGDNATVTFDPTSNPAIKTEDPKTGILAPKKGRPNEIGLGHELIHTNHIIDGDVDFTSTKNTYKTASGPVTQTQPNEELRTVGLQGVKKKDITENQLRKENGQNNRGAY